MSMSTNNNAAQHEARPWWRHGHVWLVIAGPLVVVIAGLATFYIAAQHPDPVLTRDHAEERVNKPEPAEEAGLTPAVQARNHAATGRPPSSP